MTEKNDQTGIPADIGETPATGELAQGAAEPAAESVESQAPPQDMELAAMKERLIRLQADFDNFRKRAARDRDEHKRRATEDLLKDLISVMDHFELGLQSAARQHVKHAVIDGFEMVHRQLMDLLERAGVSTIHAEGTIFDPQLHECVSHIHSDTHPENTVVRETRRGYRLGNYILRAPQVVVSSGAHRHASPGE